MILSVVLKDNLGKTFEGEFELRPQKPGRKQATANQRHRHAAAGPATHPRTPSEALQRLHDSGAFKSPRELKAVEAELAKIHCNFPKASLAKALERAEFLTRRGSRGTYRWIQRYPAGA